MTLHLISKNRCFQGEQRYYQHDSEVTKSTMSFSIYLPDEALAGQACPTVLYLSGLTCSPDNVTHKGHFQQKCSELGVIFIAPDTSPKGDDIPDDERYYLGQAASYYVNATQAPWQTNYQMQSYLVEELYDLVREHFSISSIGIMGHSMGGHGALMLGFKFPSQFVSVSAIAPICSASSSQWGQEGFAMYLGEDSALWANYDAAHVIAQANSKFNDLLVDQGQADEFYKQGQLQPQKLIQACEQVEQPLTYRLHAGFDHSYYFIKTVMPDHIEYHWQKAQLHGYR